MKAKLITKQPITWGGFNPDVPNYICIEMELISKTSTNVTVQVTENAMRKITTTTPATTVNPITGEILTTPIPATENSYFELYQNTRKPTNITVTAAEFNQLFAATDSYLVAENPTITILERELKRNSVALWLYYTNDFFENGKCGYNTTPNDWKICE